MRIPKPKIGSEKRLKMKDLLENILNSKSKVSEGHNISHKANKSAFPNTVNFIPEHTFCIRNIFLRNNVDFQEYFSNDLPPLVKLKNPTNNHENQTISNSKHLNAVSDIAPCNNNFTSKSKSKSKINNDNKINNSVCNQIYQKNDCISIKEFDTKEKKKEIDLNKNKNNIDNNNIDNSNNNKNKNYNNNNIGAPAFENNCLGRNLNPLNPLIPLSPLSPLNQINNISRKKFKGLYDLLSMTAIKSTDNYLTNKEIYIQDRNCEVKQEDQKYIENKSIWSNKDGLLPYFQGQQILLKDNEELKEENPKINDEECIKDCISFTNIEIHHKITLKKRKNVINKMNLQVGAECEKGQNGNKEKMLCKDKSNSIPNGNLLKLKYKAFSKKTSEIKFIENHRLQNINYNSNPNNSNNSNNSNNNNNIKIILDSSQKFKQKDLSVGKVSQLVSTSNVKSYQKILFNSGIEKSKEDAIKIRSESASKKARKFKLRNVEPHKIILLSKFNNKCNIIIYHQDYKIHERHMINLTFELINRFNEIAFLIKDDNYNLKEIALISKILSLQLTKKHISKEFLKSKEFVFSIKEKLLKILYGILNHSNELPFHFREEYFAFYKALIGDGNNHILIKNTLKQRWWWSFNDYKDLNQTHFLWTQWKKQKFIEALPIKNESIINKNNFNKSSQNSENQSDIINSPILLHEPSLEKNEEEKNKKLEEYFDLRKVVKNILNQDSANSHVNNGWEKHKIYNKLEYNFHLVQKKFLYLNMKEYYELQNMDPFFVIPITYHTKHLNDQEFKKFEENFIEMQKRQGKKFHNIWIIKPGENSNRGHGIMISRNIEEIKERLSKNSPRTSLIIQKYIERPLLIMKRKFDIRCYALVTSINGRIKGYFYDEGYIRTSSQEYNLKCLGNKFIHLTNDAIQKKSDDYGKHEMGNKLSFSDFQEYLDNRFKNLNINFYRDIWSQIKKIITDTIRATYFKLDSKRRCNSFELFGYDFMIDKSFKIFLIEVNTNPCLEQSSLLLSRIIPNLIDNTIRIVLDPIYSPIETFNSKKKFNE